MTDKKNIEYVESENTYIDGVNFINFWYGNIDRSQWSCEYEYRGALIPSENSKDITLQIARNMIGPDEAQELLELLYVIFEDAKTELEKIAGPQPPVLTERLEFRLTKDELKTLTTAAETERKTRSELLRDLIHGVAEE